MTFNQTPSAERIHIGIFGKRNAGKSSLINALAGQPVSIVSDFKGTTTDPVKKAMELLPLGPVVLIDTPGLDDTGELGSLRIEKTQQILNTTDIALLVIDGQLGITEEDIQILQQIRKKQIPFVIAVNKMDLAPASPVLPDEISPEQVLYVSAAAGTQIHELKELLAKQLGQTPKHEKSWEISSIPETLSYWSFPLTKLLRKAVLSCLSSRPSGIFSITEQPQLQ